MTWYLIIILTGLQPGYPDLREEIKQPSAERCWVEKTKYIKSVQTTPPGPYRTEVECVQK